MALQTSGAISLNQIHIEAGGTTGTQTSLNDSDNRDLIGKASGAQSSFSEWYGAELQTYNKYTFGGAQDSDLFGGGWPPPYAYWMVGRSAVDEAPNIGLVGDFSFSLGNGGFITSNGSAPQIGFDQESGLATELNKWDKLTLTWGNGGTLTFTGLRGDWTNQTLGFTYPVTLITGQSCAAASSTTDNNGVAWDVHVANGNSHVMTFDDRL